MSILDEKQEEYLYSVDGIIRTHLSDIFSQVNFLIIVQIVTKAIYQLPFERFGTIITIDEKTETIHWHCIDLCASGEVLYTNSFSRMKMPEQQVTPDDLCVRRIERNSTKHICRTHTRPFSRRPHGVRDTDKQSILEFMQKGKQYTITEIVEGLNIPKTAVAHAITDLTAELLVIRTGTETWELPTEELRKKANNRKLWYYMTDEERCAFFNSLSNTSLDRPEIIASIKGPSASTLRAFVFKHYEQCAKFICNWVYSSLKKALYYRIIKLHEIGEEAASFYEELVSQLTNKQITNQTEGETWKLLITHYLKSCPDYSASFRQIENDFGVSRGFVKRMMLHHKPDCIVEIGKASRSYKLIESEQ